MNPRMRTFFSTWIGFGTDIPARSASSRFLNSFPDFIAPWSSFKIPVFSILRTVMIVRRSKTSSSDSVSSLLFILTLRSLSYRTSLRRTFSSTLSLKETQSFLLEAKRISAVQIDWFHRGNQVASGSEVESYRFLFAQIDKINGEVGVGM